MKQLISSKWLCACLCSFLLLSVFTANAQSVVGVIAHRGYWKTEGSAQNSLASLKKAADAGVYGSEFDVHLTQDNVLVVFHDNEIEDLKIQETPYKKLKRLRLPNGEKLPTLKKFLKQGKRTKDVQLIFELKSHATPERDDEAARRSVEMVNRMHLSDRTTYIAFSLDAAKSLRKYAPEAEVYYLNGDLAPQELKALDFSGMDYHYKVIQKHPEWVEEAHRLGMKVNVWTVNTKAVMQEMMDKQVDYLTTDHPEEALHLIKNSQTY